MATRPFVMLATVCALAVATAAQPKEPARDEPATSLPLASSEPVSSALLPTPAPTKQAPRVSPAHMSDDLTCPKGMTVVDGEECSEVDQPCLEWADDPGADPMRCLHFGESRCVGRLTHARFCIDRYEYPNVAGARPVVMKSWDQASSLCAARGRRLCKGSEWTLACEGEERLPYPYGRDRDASACNVDLPVSGPFPRWVEHPPKGVGVSLVDWRARSGEWERCVSPYGVYDMTGNVDEWVVNESGHPFASGLKGGYWGPVRDRCRPMTVAHDTKFAFYQIGFRCCADAPRAK